jgi:hypothetical protein
MLDFRMSVLEAPIDSRARSLQPYLGVAIDACDVGHRLEEIVWIKRRINCISGPRTLAAGVLGMACSASGIDRSRSLTVSARGLLAQTKMNSMV